MYELQIDSDTAFFSENLAIKLKLSCSPVNVLLVKEEKSSNSDRLYCNYYNEFVKKDFIEHMSQQTGCYRSEVQLMK